MYIAELDGCRLLLEGMRLHHTVGSVVDRVLHALSVLAAQGTERKR